MARIPGKMSTFKCTGTEFHLLLGVRNELTESLETPISKIQEKEKQYGYYTKNEDLEKYEKHTIKCTPKIYKILKKVLMAYRNGDTEITCNKILREKPEEQEIQNLILQKQITQKKKTLKELNIEIEEKNFIIQELRRKIRAETQHLNDLLG